MAGNHSQAPYGDFWANSGNYFVVLKKQPKSYKRPGAPKPIFLKNPFGKFGLFLDETCAFWRTPRPPPPSILRFAATTPSAKADWRTVYKSLPTVIIRIGKHKSQPHVFNHIVLLDMLCIPFKYRNRK